MAQARHNEGNYFEDFKEGQVIVHGVPRTLHSGDTSLYIALTGERHPVHCAAPFARSLGYPRERLHDWLVFHTVFGKSVPDISLNAVANLGYAEGVFGQAVFPGDTLQAESEVIGRKENSNGKTGIVWVRTRGVNQDGNEVLRYCRWVMVHKRNPGKNSGINSAPELQGTVSGKGLNVPSGIQKIKAGEMTRATGGRWFWEDYEIGERIFHVDGMTIDECDHTNATRLYQNTAKVHFNQHQMQASRFGKRLMYGGHVISVASALSFNGLENSLGVLAINGGNHCNPTFAGDTLYAFSDVVDKADLGEYGALGCRLYAVKNHDPKQEPAKWREVDDKGKSNPHPHLVLELDTWLLLPKR